MTTIVRAAARGAVMLLCLGSASCSGTEDAPANFAGTWEGLFVLQPGTRTWMPLSLTQRGDQVAGVISDYATVVGTADGATLSFTLDLAGLCAGSASGTGTIERLPDRDRLRLAYRGVSTCSGAPAGAFEASGTLDRMRCPAPASACHPSPYAEAVPTPYCADLSSDVANCGSCGQRCGDLQVCASGQCQVPACTGPVLFQEPTTAWAADTLWSLVLADVDADGALDALASGAMLPAEIEPLLVVLRNGGDGARWTRTATALAPLFPGSPIGIPSAIATGDLDGDGVLDVAAYVASNWPSPGTVEGEVVTLLGNGDGSFRAGERFSTGPDDGLMDVGVRVIAVADLNRDGVADVAARSGRASAVTVRLARGDGTLGPAVEYAVASRVEALAAADLDGDGLLDLVVASENSYEPQPWRPLVSVLPGRGDGTFGAPLDSPGVAAPQDLAVSDFDEDGAPDLVVISWYSWAPHQGPNVSVLLGDGHGTFQAPVVLEQEPRSFTWSVGVADLDGDGHQDLVVGDDHRGLLLFLGHGDGTFTRFENPVPGGAGLVAAADLDRDGRMEEVLLGDEGGRETVGVYFQCSP